MMTPPQPGNPIRARSAGVLLAVLAIVMVALIGRVAYIQYRLGDRLAAHADRQHRSRSVLLARRGLIMDRRGRVLATTVSRYAIYADPAMLADPAEVAARVAPIIDSHPEEVLTKLEANRDRRYVVLLREATDAQAEAVQGLDIFGLGVEERLSRQYPMGRLAAHTVGFVGRDGKGLEGVELAMDRWLGGRDGHRTMIRDVRRRAIWADKTEYRQPRDGANVVLTLDAAIQEFAEQQLEQTVLEFHGRGGCAVVLDPRTGEVLALANWPTFNPNHPTDFPVPSRRNRAITDPIEPGSTMKPFIAAGALALGVTTLDEVFDCQQGYYAKVRLRDHHPYGNLTFREVVIKSSNIGMAMVGERMGNERLHAICRDFGFGTPTGLELCGESGGMLRSLRTWSRPDTTRITMGQGPIVATPVQMAGAFCALVNGGHRLKLTLQRAVIDVGGEVLVHNDQPTVLGRAVPEATANEFAREVLLAVVQEGTGRQAKLEHWQVLGKTGTAQVASPNGGYEEGAYIGSFLGAAPASDPRLVVMLMVDRPDRSLGYYGGTVAAPAVAEILKQSLAYLGVAPDKSTASRVAGAAR